MKLYSLSTFLWVAFFLSSVEAKWVVHSYTGSEAPQGVQSLSVVQKVIESKSGPFVTGLITNTVVEISEIQKAKNQPLDPDAMADQVRTVLQTGPWTKSKVEGLNFYTLKWKEERRYLRLIIQKDQKVVRMSFANLRQPYVFQESLETDILQRAFFQIEKKKNKNKTAALWPLIWKDVLPEAQASTVTIAELQRAYQGFLGSIDNIGRNLGLNSAKEIAAGIQGLGGNLQVAASTGAASINNLADSVRSTFNFMNGVKFGAGMGFGFAAGSAVANLAMDQGAKVLRSAYYMITGKMKPEEKALLDNRIGKALDTWEQETQKLLDLEKDLSAYEIAFSGAFLLPPEMALDNVSKAHEKQIDLESKIKTLKDRLGGLNETERAACISNIKSLEDQLVYTNTVLGKLADTQGNKDRMCQQFTNLLNKWAASEAALHQAKMIISVERTTFLGQLERQQLEALNNPVDSRARENECRSNRLKLADAEEEKYRFNNCSSKAGDTDCSIIQRHVEEWKKAANDCPAEVAKGQQGFSERDVARMGEAVKRHREEAIQGLDSIAASTCQEGEVGGPCSGKVGLIADLRKTYESKASALRQHCPQLNFQQPSQNFAKSSYQEGYPNPQNDLRNLNRAPQSTEAKSSGGIFSSIGNFLKRIWGAVF